MIQVGRVNERMRQPEPVIHKAERTDDTDRGIHRLQSAKIETAQQSEVNLNV